MEEGVVAARPILVGMIVSKRKRYHQYPNSSTEPNRAPTMHLSWCRQLTGRRILGEEGEAFFLPLSVSSQHTHPAHMASSVV